MHVFYWIFKKESRETAQWSHGSMLKTEMRGHHRLPNQEIGSGSFGTSVSQRDLKVASKAFRNTSRSAVNIYGAVHLEAA
jgi:hypothetical protein